MTTKKITLQPLINIAQVNIICCLFLAEAGDRTVAGEVSEPGFFKVGKMEPVSLEQGESLGGLFQDMMPLEELPGVEYEELPAVDYLDSFMDLSNFLNMVGVP